MNYPIYDCATKFGTSLAAVGEHDPSHGHFQLVYFSFGLIQAGIAGRLGGNEGYRLLLW